MQTENGLVTLENLGVGACFQEVEVVPHTTWQY
jgi:hypothetical protein